jgi:hypothetical protein
MITISIVSHSIHISITHTIEQMDNLIDFIYDSCASFIKQDLLSKLPTHTQPLILHIPLSYRHFADQKYRY